MVFDKIEISYNRLVFRFKIKYSETRKPSFAEFLILSTLIEHPSRDKSLKQIFEEDFKIKRTSLFERTLRDLTSFKVIKFNTSQTGLGTLEFDTPIKSFEVNAELKKSFKAKEYVISQSDKYQDVRYVWDPLTKESYITKDIDWNQKVQGHKGTCKVGPNNFNDHNLNLGDVADKAKKILSERPDIFGENSKIVELETSQNIELKSINDFSKYLDAVPIAFESNLFMENDNVVVKSDNIFIQNYFDKNINERNNLFANILDSYKNKLKETFIPKSSTSFGDHLDDRMEILNSLPIKTNWNTLFINQEDINSISKALDNQKLTRNVDFIIVYNNKISDTKISLNKNKLILNIGAKIDDIRFQQSSFIFMQDQKEFNGFALINSNFKMLQVGAPVVYELKNKSNVNFKQSFTKVIDDLKKSLNDCLQYGQYNEAALYVSVLIKFGFDKEINEMLFDLLQNDIRKAKIFNEFRNSLESHKLEKQIISLEKITKDVIVGYSQENTIDEIFEMIQLYNFKNEKVLLSLIRECDFTSDFNFAKNLNDYLSNRKIDGWKFNIAKCLKSMSDYFVGRLKAGIFDAYTFNSTTFKQHVLMYDTIGSVITSIFTNESFENMVNLSSQYKTIQSLVIDNMKNAVGIEIDHLREYLLGISGSLREFYKKWHSFATQYLQGLEKDSIEQEAKLTAVKLINKIDSAMNEKLSPGLHNMPVEVKLEYLRHVEDKKDFIDALIHSKDELIYTALELFYGSTKDMTPKILFEQTKRMKEVL